LAAHLAFVFAVLLASAAGWVAPMDLDQRLLGQG
jgi:hypothetical protein